MNTNILAKAAALSDPELLVRLDALAGKEREASVELLAHLAALDTRPALYASQGYGSLFGYCTQALRLSEDAACNRIEAARACRRFPVILDLLTSGSMTLTSVRLLGRHLTAENHEAILAKASGRNRREIIPGGDPGAIFDRALDLLLEKVEKTKLAAAARPRSRRAIRPGTDTDVRKGALPSRHVPREVRRAVWHATPTSARSFHPPDGGARSATFLELHHIRPHAKQGPATVANISLRCHRHNQTVASLPFMPAIVAGPSPHRSRSRIPDQQESRHCRNAVTALRVLGLRGLASGAGLGVGGKRGRPGLERSQQLASSGSVASANQEIDADGQAQGRGHPREVLGGKPGIDARLAERHARQVCSHRIAKRGHRLQICVLWSRGWFITDLQPRNVYTALPEQGLDDWKDLGAPLFDVVRPEDVHQLVRGQISQAAPQLVSHG